MAEVHDSRTLGSRIITSRRATHQPETSASDDSVKYKIHFGDDSHWDLQVLFVTAASVTLISVRGPTPSEPNHHGGGVGEKGSKYPNIEKGMH